MFRLDEIINQRAKYLLTAAPKTPFNEYKYISTVYRICSLMGWMRASNIEYSNLEVKNTKEYQKARKAINGFEISLADGQHVEEKVLLKICELTKIDISALEKKHRTVLASKVEDKIMSFCYTNNVTSAFSLDVSKRGLLVKHLVDELCVEMSLSKKGEEFYNSSLVKNCIDNMDWKEGLIYRDWQYAIGDVMIKINTGGDRKYDVIGYKEFEDTYNKTDDPPTKKWVERAEKLFKNLDIITPLTFDVRSEQLKRIFVSTYELLEINSKLVDSNIEIAKDTLNRFSETYRKLCHNNTQSVKSKNIIARFIKIFR